MVLQDFDNLLKKYAQLIISKGLNVQKGHTLALTIDVEQVHLARLLTEAAYEKGASEVIVDYTDDFITRHSDYFMLQTKFSRMFHSIPLINL